jgi:hypothetical protein
VLQNRKRRGRSGHGLTINDCRFAGEVGGGTDDRGIAVAPIMSVASEDTCLPSLNDHLRAVAIVFDFVNPVLALWWLIDQGGKLWLDESEAGGYAKHYSARLKKKPGLSDVRASSAHGERWWVARGTNHHL